MIVTAERGASATGASTTAGAAPAWLPHTPLAQDMAMQADLAGEFAMQSTFYRASAYVRKGPQVQPVQHRSATS